MPSTHAVVDIETTSVDPTSGRILSVGLVGGSMGSPEPEFKFYQLVQPDPKYNSTEGDSRDTLQWWANQPPMAFHEAFLGDSFAEGTTTLEDTLELLSDFIQAEKPRYIWAKGPSFDLAFLARAYRSMGKKIPWRHTRERDMRTIEHLASRLGWSYRDVTLPPKLIAHVADYDAETEFRTLFSAFNFIEREATRYG